MTTFFMNKITSLLFLPTNIVIFVMLFFVLLSTIAIVP